jgi:hypothetical protein
MHVACHLSGTRITLILSLAGFLLQALSKKSLMKMTFPLHSSFTAPSLRVEPLGIVKENLLFSSNGVSGS